MRKAKELKIKTPKSEKFNYPCPGRDWKVLLKAWI
jgi:hypothetical protein